MCLSSFLNFVKTWRKLEKDLGFSTTTYMEIFLQIAHNPELTTGEIANEVNTSQPTMYRALNTFYKAGFGRKVQDMDDPRMFHFILTDKGQELIDILKGEEITK